MRPLHVIQYCVHSTIISISQGCKLCLLSNVGSLAQMAALSGQMEEEVEAARNSRGREERGLLEDFRATYEYCTSKGTLVLIK